MKIFTEYSEKINESKMLDDLYAEVDDNEKAKINLVADKLRERSKNALYLTMLFAHTSGNATIKDNSSVVLDLVSKGYMSYTKTMLDSATSFDDNKKWVMFNDGSKNTTWQIYKIYLAKTMAKEYDMKDNLDKANMFLRTFKNTWPESWKDIEASVNAMHAENKAPIELNKEEEKTKDVTKQETTAAVEDSLEKDNALLAGLIKKSGINKGKLAEYVALVINRSFKEVNDKNTMEWKAKIAKNDPNDNDFILGISAMVCGAYITGDKTLINDMFSYFDKKTQDDLKQIQNKLK